ncbi:MAG: metallophosphoesterase, partial [Muribaculaceae bacterium]|nr:metallophosphoesterase [Muribaculaceae bacterium]
MSRILKNWMVAAILMAMGMMAQAQRIAVICDIHVTPGNANESKLREVVSQINQSDADVVVFAGDLTNEGSDEQLRNVKTIIDGLTKPVYVIPGNHENTWSQSACKTFNDIWGQDRFV